VEIRTGNNDSSTSMSIGNEEEIIDDKQSPPMTSSDECNDNEANSENVEGVSE
jgi:hypothetical protein